jgi:OOP family OmpA-OmpF porin
MLHANGDPDISLTGHTDAKGSDQYNINLSRQRANQVKDYLLIKKNYKGHIKVIAMGERQPIKIHSKKRLQLSNQEWRALNRRVESCKQ